LHSRDDQNGLKQSQGPHLRIHAISVFVRDQEQSLRFYLDKLGFCLVREVRDRRGRRWVAVAPPDGSTVLALIAPEPDSKQYQLIGRSTDITLITDNVPAKFREWSERGVRFVFTPRLRRVQYDRLAPAPGSEDGEHAAGDPGPVWGGVFTRFMDLDGNSFALVSFDEVSQALERERRAAAAKAEADRRSIQELEIAKQVQARLFPQTLPVLATLDYAGICIQASQVGGDYYDFLDLGRERLGLVVADISGKGISAALLMANLQANLRSQCAIAAEQPERFLQSVNRLFQENSSDSAYASLFFAEYNEKLRSLRYANCGHLCALVLRNDGSLESLESTGMVLGLFQDWNCVFAKLSFCPGDTLLLYTDGITESFNHAGEEFGEQRLVDSLRRYREQAPQVLISSIVAEAKAFSAGKQFDDITLIVARGR
jgi:serine phosphatase RsbU (regulator of sigma subunit)